MSQASAGGDSVPTEPQAIETAEAASKDDQARIAERAPAADNPASVPEREETEGVVREDESTRGGESRRSDDRVLRDKNDRIPEWVINPGLGGIVGAIGVAPPKGMGTKEQLDEARLNARIELVAMLEGRVQRAGRTELDENYRATATNRSEDSRKNILGIDRNILDGVLAGTRQRALWFDPDNGEVYVWMVLDGAVLDRVDHYVVDSVSVFKANTPAPSEYRPRRRRPDVPSGPDVRIKTPDKPTAPARPESAIEKLEGQLKDIETIPSKEDDSSRGSESEGN